MLSLHNRVYQLEQWLTCWQAVLRYYCDAGRSMISAPHSAPSLPHAHGEVWRSCFGTPGTLTHIEVLIALVAAQYLQGDNHPEGSHYIIPQCAVRT